MSGTLHAGTMHNALLAAPTVSTRHCMPATGTSGGAASSLLTDPLGLFEDMSTAPGTSSLDPMFAADPLGLFDEDAPQVMPASCMTNRWTGI